MNITTKQFQLLSDINLVWDFLVETYDWKNDSGRPAPFFEYALTATWMDSSYSFLDRFWFDGDKVVAFAYYEAPVTDIYFNVRKGYEFLADELIEYAVTTMPHFNGEQQFVFSDGQQFLKDAAAKRGLAAAALTKHYHTLKPLGATHMTGGDDEFYKKIGYEKGYHWTIWKKE
ncbi:hypothetical protein SAMN04487775_10140 [Treponema bryantii]|uniref:N-acetyltransferase domain-containing protein n=1 Tax=Treponema bryantii TaxID=163 RepID=A0A1I3HRZ1_9SPIR|nr:hypothetical protein [Treponema bryantii]SFI38546.1 hypothetical protein SAMN04487775_10140 [Treponema bryantii]